jgi:hypothetical protein
MLVILPIVGFLWILFMILTAPPSDIQEPNHLP